MTWGEFKEKMQQRGVTDDTLIECLFVEGAFPDIEVTFNAAGAVDVRTDD